MPNSTKILIVDDDPVSLKVLHIVLAKESSYEIYQARDAEEGIKIAHEVRPDIIISDYYMPGKDGFEFCHDIKSDKELASTIFILLTTETDAVKKVTGLEGGADDYIEKTVSSDVLLSKIKAFLRIKHLQNELMEQKELLERNFKELIAVLLKILEINIPGTSDRAHLSRAAAEFILEKLEVSKEERDKIVFGVMLHEIGKIGLPDHIIKGRLKNLSADEVDIFYQHPVIGSTIVSTITGFKTAAYDVYHQYENYDGSGMPDGLKSHQISIGTKIIRSIIFLEELQSEGCSFEEVVEKIRFAMNKVLDPIVATHLVEFLIQNNKDLCDDKNKIPLEDLKPGMVIAEDIFSSKGAKILPKGVQLQEWMLKIIMERNLVDPIIGGVYICKV